MTEPTAAEMFASEAMTKAESYERRQGISRVQKWLDDCNDDNLKTVVLAKLSDPDITIGSIKQAFERVVGIKMGDTAIKNWRVINDI